MGRTVRYRTDAGEVPAHLAVPESGSGPGVIVVHARWGLVDHIRDVAERFAAEGFVAFAPDLYDGETPADDGAARRRLHELQVHDAALRLSTAIGYLLARDEVRGRRVGVVGYGVGGALAIVTADRAAGKVGACDVYHGLPGDGDPELSAIACPVVLRVGTEDAAVPVERVRAVADRLRHAGAEDVRVETYEGAGHAFFDDARGTYHEETARRAWRDTLALFLEHLGDRGA